jgi:hypothetical protein
MSERMIFCLGEGRLKSSGIGYQKNNMVFNKQVSKERYDAVLSQIKTIFKDLKLELNKNSWTDEWKKVTKEQWIQLSQIAEFDIGVVEGIVGFRPGDKVTITVEGKSIEISRESAKALNLID